MSARRYTAFIGHEVLAAGPEVRVAAAAHAALGAGASRVLIFDDATGEQVELDLRHPTPTIAGRASLLNPNRGPGRPRLGVVPREVTLLPRHWDWLATQPGGASAALRRLVETAARGGVPAQAEAERKVREAVYRVATSLAGDQPGYEEALRALFAEDWTGFMRQIEAWPAPVREYLARLVSEARARP